MNARQERHRVSSTMSIDRMSTLPALALVQRRVALPQAK
jgi:hypothetical protein